MSEFDNELYSRQILTYGQDSMKKLTTTNIYIYGLNGLGNEISKCITLSGVNKIILGDKDEIINENIPINFLLNENDIGKLKLETLKIKLNELNSYVNFETHNIEIDKLEIDYLLDKEINVLVLCDISFDIQIKLNKLCIENDIKFISTSNKGLYGYIFCDFGDNFITNDIDGEKIKEGIIVDIDQNYVKNNINKKELVSIKDKDPPDFKLKTYEPHNLQENDIIDIICWDSIKCISHNITKIINNYEFLIDTLYSDEDLLNNSHFDEGGYYKFIETKKNIKIDFNRLDDSIKNPSYTEIGYRSDITNLIHNINVFCNIKNENEDIDNLKKKFIDSNSDKLNNIEEETLIINKIFDNLNGRLPAVDSILGGLCSQEIIKGCTSKYNPINQWCYYDCLELIEDNNEKDNEDEYISNNKYCDQIKIFGNDKFNKIQNSKIFIVGAGAIGSEHIKNFAMMGIKNLIITDYDQISKSNLNRQFLFRPYDINKFKSEIAAIKGMEINSDCVIQSHNDKVSIDTLHKFNDRFFDQIDCVTNALDNIEARKFVDLLCVKHKKSLIESGTLGTKCNVQMIISNLTENYGASNDPEEKSIPLCTLKNFPYKYEHTVQYAKEIFEEYFTIFPQNIKKINTNFEEIEKMNLSELCEIYNSVKIIENVEDLSIITLYEIVYKIWYKNLYLLIKDIIEKYPQDFKNEDGTFFWKENKKFPEILEFNVKNEMIINFLLNTIYLLEEILFDNNSIKKGNNDLILKYYDNEKEIEINNEEIDDKEEIIKRLKIIKEHNFNFKILEFEKDNDENHHIDFIKAVSDIRSYNYSIDIKDKLEVKKISGNIIPAVSSTTTVVSGLVSIELYKILLNFNKIEKFKNSYYNLALPMYTFTEPFEVKSFKIYDIVEKLEKDYNIWTIEKIRKDIKFCDLIDIWNNNKILKYDGKSYDLELDYITHNSKFIYNNWDINLKKNITKKLNEIINIIENNEIDISVSIKEDSSDEESDNEEEIELPIITITIEN